MNIFMCEYNKHPFLTLNAAYDIWSLIAHGSLFLLVCLLLAGCLQFSLWIKPFYSCLPKSAVTHWLWWDDFHGHTAAESFPPCSAVCFSIDLVRKDGVRERVGNSSTFSQYKVSNSEIYGFQVRSSGTCAIIPQVSFKKATAVSGFQRMQ